jgi:uncharacterized protein
VRLLDHELDLRSHPFRFFFWVLLLSTPLYIWGVFWPVHGLPFELPATAVMIFLPAAVATIQTRREQGIEAAWDLWRKVFDVSRIKSPGWFWAALLFMPAATVVAHGFMRFAQIGLPPAPQVPLALAPAIFALYFSGAIFEEIGWTGYATEPLQRQFGIIGAGSIIGAVWAGWHIVPWWLGQGHPLWWVASQAVLTVVLRIVMGWIYAKGGRSLFLAILFHATINTAYSLFPNGGSHYNPAVTAAAVLFFAGLAPRLRRTILKCL